MDKPQLLFELKPTNRETGPFKPLLQSKPHASVPLETKPVPVDDESQLQYAAHILLSSQHGRNHVYSSRTQRYLSWSTQKQKANKSQTSRYPHPYQLEIEQYRYPSFVYKRADPIPYHPFDSTTATFVDTEDAVDEMLEELKQASEIAIDLEHHDLRSYIGIVSLMQVSTRDRDWMVDTLKPWRRKLSRLNEVFADPKILKVLHGAYMDIVWLQRDLGLYLVGLFDTHYAARALGYPGGSLAYLLKRFANVDAQKQYQTADWRVRPLPQELFDYARSDTHYLLYIYDCMRNELIQRSNMMLPNHEGDKLWDVLQRSSETALQRYEHPIYDYDLGSGPMGWYKSVKRTPALLSKEQFAVFRTVHQWRDEVAREQDDSTYWVMPNHQVMTVAKEMPTNRAALLGLAQPATQTLRLRVDELVSVIEKAKADGKEGPDMFEVMAKVDPSFLKAVPAKPAPNQGIAALVPKTQPTTSGDSNVSPIRSTSSAFWGGAFESSAHSQQKRQLSTAADVNLTVPLPPLTAEVFADPKDVASTPTKPQAKYVETSASEPVAASSGNDDDDVFVLKDNMSKKRKRAHAVPMNSDGMAAQSDEVAIQPAFDDEEDRTRLKAERKKARKEAKRAVRRAPLPSSELNGDGEDGEVLDDEPFDYEAAPSILNPARESRVGRDDRGKGAGGKKREVNPYAKSLDAPKGLPRAQRERAGRSATFK